MSDRRYVNLRVTPQKWKNEYFGDFEAPLPLFPLPVPDYWEVQECVGAGQGYIKTFDELTVGQSILIDGDCWEVFSSSGEEPITLDFTTVYADCATCQAAQPSPTPTPTITPTITPTASVTPSVTPSITPTRTVTPTSTPIPVTPSVTPTNTATPSVTPSITPTTSVTPTSSITPTPTITPTTSVTPTHTPTPTPSPVPQFFILAEDTDEILTEGADNLITQDGDSEASVSMSSFPQGVLIEVDDGATNLIRSEVTQDTDTANQNYSSSVNLEFSWTHMVSTDDLYQINIYEDEGGSQGRLLESSSRSNNGTYTYTGKTSVIVGASKHTTNGQILNITSGVGNFTYGGQTYYFAAGQQQWGIDSANNNTPWGSAQYQTGIITPGDPALPQYKLVFVRTSLANWTRYTYTFSTQTWSNPQNISTGVSNYGASDQVSLVDNLP